MAISFPLSLPVVRGASRMTIRASSTAGVSESPFTGEQQVQVHQREVWAMDFEVPPMDRADAEEWIGGLLLALNGREGTFLAGDPLGILARGTWAGGSPLVNGGSQTGKTLAIDGLSAAVTAKPGDWAQLGSAGSTRLHKVTALCTANGSGQMNLELWPRLRSSPADNATLTIASAKGIWRLASNTREWSIERAKKYGLAFSAVEAI